MVAWVGAGQAPAHGQAADRATLSGYVRDLDSGAALAGTTVLLRRAEEERSAGTVTNDQGFYSLTLPTGRYQLTVSYVGYRDTTQALTLARDRTLSVELEEQPLELGEVQVAAEAEDRTLERVEMSAARLDMRALDKLPTFLGELDVTRSLLLLPGVSTVGDGASGFNVRGGNVDQNLVLFNGTPIFYPSHLFGFFSAFNPAVLGDLTLYKGGIPARLGGRLSSVLDVRQRAGNKKAYEISGGVGLVSSRLAAEGPLIEDRTSFLVAGRTSYVNWLLHRVPDQDIQNSHASFYDVNLGVHHRLGSNDELSLTGYRSRDGFEFAADTLYAYSTTSAALTWNHPFDQKLFSSITGTYTHYAYEIEGQRPSFGFALRSGIDQYGLKADLTWFPHPAHTVEMGMHVTGYRFDNGAIEPTGAASNVNAFSLEKEQSLETALYIGDTFDISDRLTLRGGLRYALFYALGPGTGYTYAEGQPREAEAITDTLAYASGEVIEAYHGPEPRLSLRYRLGDEHSVKLSYNRMRQYLHLISNTTAASPLDVWKSSNRALEPQVGDQVALGYFRNFLGNTLTTSAEMYYKRTQHLVDYKAGADLVLNPLLEADLLDGEGRAYGLELMARKKTGAVTGWLSYSYARAERRVAGARPSEQINFGRYYPANHDRPHQLTLTVGYQENRYFSWNANFVYRSGRPITYPVSKFVIDGVAVANYSSRNQFRIPDYHRLDVALTVDLNPGEDTAWDGGFTFSLYNVYGRNNAYSIFFGQKEGAGAAQAYRLSVLGAIFPSLSIDFEF